MSNGTGLTVLAFCFPCSVIGLEKSRHHQMQNSTQSQPNAPSKAKLSKLQLLVLERQKNSINEYRGCNPYFSSCKSNLRLAGPLEEKVLFLKGYFNLDYKHASHHVEAFKASVSRSSEASLSLSEVYFPQLIYAW